MKQLFRAILVIAMIAFVMPIGIYADDIEVCQVMEDYVLVSKSTSTVINTTVTLDNDSNEPQMMQASASRTQYTETSGGISLSIFEELFGVSAEVVSGVERSITISASPVVPPRTTYYVDFGYSRVKGTIRKIRINADCSVTNLNEYEAEYSTGPYIRVR